MYITEEELKNRLNKTDVQIKERVRKIRGSVKTDNPEDRLTHKERVAIGILEELDTQKNVAELFGVSPQTVSLASRGIVSPTVGIDKELKEDVEAGREKIGKSKEEHERKIQDQLIANLASALGHVANNIDTTKAVEASKIALDMSKILDRVSGNREEARGNRTAIIINVPSMKEEKAYQTIEV